MYKRLFLLPWQGFIVINLVNYNFATSMLAHG